MRATTPPTLPGTDGSTAVRRQQEVPRTMRPPRMRTGTSNVTRGEMMKWPCDSGGDRRVGK